MNNVPSLVVAGVPLGATCAAVLAFAYRQATTGTRVRHVAARGQRVAAAQPNSGLGLQLYVEGVGFICDDRKIYGRGTAD